MGGGGGEVDVVVTGTSTNHDLQLLGGVEHLGVNLIRTDDQGVGFFHSLQELSLLSIFLEQHQLIAGCLNLCLNAIHSSCCERLLCCN